MKLSNFRQFIKNFGKGRYIKLGIFFAMSLIAGCLEFVGIALIYPFIMMIINPDIVTNSTYYNKYVQITGIDNIVFTAFAVGFLVLLTFIIKNIYIIINTFIQSRFVSSWKRDLTKRFMEYFIYAPYKDTMVVSQSDKMYILTTLIGQSIDGFVMRALNLMTNTIIIFMIILLLFVKFPLAATTTVIFVAVSMSIQNKYFKSKIARLSKILNEKSRKYTKTIFEIINNLKEFKILSAENSFYDNYASQEAEYRNIQTINGFYGSIPPYIIEILIVSSLLLLGAIISISNKSGNSVLIASYAIIAASIFRIAPALNRIQTAILCINSSREFVKSINSYYEKFQLGKFRPHHANSKKRLTLKNKLELRNVNFEYTEGRSVIKNLSLTIEKGDFIGIIGLSGAGKSTLADIIMGLLPIKSGEILLDGLELCEKNYPYFRQIIGYVPQQVNVLDKSFRENIAWGIPKSKINDEKIKHALLAAQIYDVVMEFEEGLDASPIVNSTGLSQGQKQRLAIARALYREPEILILDEATSSLDVHIENEITDMLSKLKEQKTIIAIAHRLSTLKACNKLVYMKEGKVVDIGTFDELSAQYEDFENLVRLSSIK